MRFNTNPARGRLTFWYIRRAPNVPHEDRWAYLVGWWHVSVGGPQWGGRTGAMRVTRARAFEIARLWGPNWREYVRVWRYREKGCGR